MRGECWEKAGFVLVEATSSMRDRTQDSVWGCGGFRRDNVRGLRFAPVNPRIPATSRELLIHSATRFGSVSSGLFVVGPKPNDFDDLLLLKDLIYEAMLDVDTARVGTLQIPYKRFERRRISKGILSNEFKQLSRFPREWRALKLLGILPRLPSVNQFVAQRSTSLLQELIS
jgi:hypothetical protein